MPGIQDPRDETTLVAGGGSGIGAGLPRRFAPTGMRVVVADIDLERAEAIAGAMWSDGGQAIAVRSDVSDREEVERAAIFVMEVGIPSDEVADFVLYGIRENATCGFTDPDLGAIFEPRIEGMRCAPARTPEPRGGDVQPEDLARCIVSCSMPFLPGGRERI